MLRTATEPASDENPFGGGIVPGTSAIIVPEPSTLTLLTIALAFLEPYRP
jgi:hypothetical protein